MTTRIQAKKSKLRAEETTPPVEIMFTPDTGTADLDDLLDEIDEVLEQNAEEFVQSYRQKGGE